MVKCKFNHVYSSQGISYQYNSNSKQMAKANPDFGGITNCMLVNANTQMVITTAAQKVYLLKIPSLETAGSFPMQGTVTAAHASDQFPDHFLFGLTENCTLSLVMP